MSCTQYLRRYWPLLVARWAVFALLMSGAAFFGGWDLREMWPLIIVASGTLNIMWIWMA